MLKSLWEIQAKLELWRQVTDFLNTLRVGRFHEESDVEPDPEKVEEESHAEWSLEDKSDEEGRENVALGEQVVWNDDVARNEGDSGVKLRDYRKLSFLGLE